VPTPLIDTALEAQRQAVIAQLAQIGDLRPGSLVERFERCGNPNPRCTRRGTRSHGTQWLLTTKVASKTRSRVIPTHALEETCNQVA